MKEKEKIYCSRCRHWSRSDTSEYCFVHHAKIFNGTDHRGSIKIYRNVELFTHFFGVHPNEYSTKYEIISKGKANEEYQCPFFIRRWYICKGPKEGPKHLLKELLENEGE